MKIKVSIEVEEELGEILYKSVKPEEGKVKKKGKGIKLELEGEDIPALQAAVNTYLNLIKLSKEVGNAGNKS